MGIFDKGIAHLNKLASESRTHAKRSARFANDMAQKKAKARKKRKNKKK